MANNIVTKMLLDDKEYAQKLNKARQNTSEFQKEINSMGKKMSGDITKGFGAVAAAIGVAGGAVETFKKLINATNDSTDKWEATMRGMKNSVDSFFTALRAGDFTSFNMGLSQMYEKGKLAAAALDALGNATMSFSYFNARNTAKFADAMTDMRDTTLSADLRRSAKETAEGILKDQTDIVDNLKVKITNTIQSLMTESNRLSAGAVGILDLETILKLDITEFGEADKQRLAEQYARYQQEIAKIAVPKKVTGYTATGGAIYSYDKNNPEYLKQVADISSQYKDAILYNELLVHKSDEWLQNLIAIANQAYSAEQALAGMQRQFNRASVTVDRQAGAVAATTTSGTLTLPSASGLSLSASPSKPSSISTPASLAVSKAPRQSISRDVFDELYNELEQETIYINSLTAKTFDGWSNAGSVIDGISRSMQGLAGIADDSTQAFMELGATVLQQTATIISSIGMAKEAYRQKQLAATGAAAAEGASSVAGIPFVGVAMAIAAAASIAAAIKNAAKFATGGIVGGTSYTGDNVLVRVNSGEMILNRDQQAALSSRLNGSGGSIVRFEIEGDRLVGILNNESKMISRRL